MWHHILGYINCSIREVTLKKLKCKENIVCFILNITMFKKKINMKSEDKLHVHSVTLLSLPMKSNAV